MCFHVPFLFLLDKKKTIIDLKNVKKMQKCGIFGNNVKISSNLIFWGQSLIFLNKENLEHVNVIIFFISVF